VPRKLGKLDIHLANILGFPKQEEKGE